MATNAVLFTTGTVGAADVRESPRTVAVKPLGTREQVSRHGGKEPPPSGVRRLDSLNFSVDGGNAAQTATAYPRRPDPPPSGCEEPRPLSPRRPRVREGSRRRAQGRAGGLASGHRRGGRRDSVLGCQSAQQPKNQDRSKLKRHGP